MAPAGSSFEVNHNAGQLDLPKDQRYLRQLAGRSPMLQVILNSELLLLKKLLRVLRPQFEQASR